MFYQFKEKSWSVFLVKGYVYNDQVRAKRCENCKSTTEALTINHHNPNLLLYGCQDSKCKHRLVRLDFEKDQIVPNKTAVPKTSNSIVCGELASVISG
jgi:hypothetical protein